MLEILAWQNGNEGKKRSEQTEKPTLFIPDFMQEPKEVDPDIAIYDTDDIRAILAQKRTE